MNQLLKNEFISKINQPLSIQNEEALNFLTEKESSELVSNLSKEVDSIINMPFVIGEIDGDNIIFRDILISVESRSSGVIFNITYVDKKTEDKVFNKYSFVILTNKILINRYLKDGGNTYTFFRREEDIIRHYNLTETF